VVVQSDCEASHISGDVWQNSEGEACICNAARRVLCSANAQACALAGSEHECGERHVCCLHAIADATVCLPRASNVAGCVDVGDGVLPPATGVPSSSSTDDAGNGGGGSTTLEVVAASSRIAPLALVTLVTLAALFI
jgi:hypothetical protein